MLALDVDQLNKTYTNGVKALKDLSLKIQSGEFLGLLGPNGAGKTTLIGILNSLVIKSSGSVSVFGHDIDQAFGQAKACIGTVPQEFNFPIFERVEDIVMNQGGFFGLTHHVAKARAEKYLSMLDLWGKRHHTARSLSGGMKRRLMIARAMVHEPQMLILDEPTAGVDIQLRRSMWSFLQEINAAGTTILLTTHYLEEAEHLCERIAIINQGELIEDRNKHDLMSQLKVESFILDLADSLPQEQLKDLMIRDLPGVTLSQVDQQTLQVDVCHSASMNDVFTILGKYNIRINSMRNKVNRLEELFLAYTDKKRETV
ncbi:MAG: ABC transporter [Coxiellaceae bacterium]|nr:ABC transporter [Coxiellaceae bacterium]|tara:strand:+ start:1982 stop:2926 length:945 start_codon:yes stop_codon:yes gene_type:complete